MISETVEIVFLAFGGLLLLLSTITGVLKEIFINKKVSGWGVANLLFIASTFNLFVNSIVLREVSTSDLAIFAVTGGLISLLRLQGNMLLIHKDLGGIDVDAILTYAFGARGEKTYTIDSIVIFWFLCGLVSSAFGIDYFESISMTNSLAVCFIGAVFSCLSLVHGYNGGTYVIKGLFQMVSGAILLIVSASSGILPLKILVLLIALSQISSGFYVGAKIGFDRYNPG